MSFKRVFKILVTLFVVSAVSLLTVLRELERRDIFSPDNLLLYERALNQFRNDHERDEKPEDPLATWKLVGPAKHELSANDKLRAVKNTEFPPGFNGRGVELHENMKGYFKTLVKKGFKDNRFNQFVSDIISIHRQLPDYRDDWCKQRNYSQNLPKVSIVICFYNEAWSTLLRTVESVLRRSPSHLLEEIILFDDFSSMGHLKTELENYVRSKPKVSLIRATQRKGLIRARVIGAQHASAPVVIFLDSHCECTTGWLQPLLDRIHQNPKTVVSPVVDIIDAFTFRYIPQPTNRLQIGGFRWDLKFIFEPVPKKVLETRKNLSEPIKSPTISGGLFAISKEFFATLGYYDEEFDIWGGENLELSFKTWMCGGTLEIVPCSHVGHVFRKTFPYAGAGEASRRNLLRLAEVWLDDYAKYYYQRLGDIRVNFGDVTRRRELREKLNCKSFEWYLHNIYPDIKLPDESVAYGQIYNMGKVPACLDMSFTTYSIQAAVTVQPCHFQGGNQFWWYTKDGKIEHDDMCLDFMFGFITVFHCGDVIRNPSQVWLYNKEMKTIRHKQSQLCLTVMYNARRRIIESDLKNCTNSPSQLWIMENYIGDRLSLELRKEMMPASNITIKSL